MTSRHRDGDPDVAGRRGIDTRRFLNGGDPYSGRLWREHPSEIRGPSCAGSTPPGHGRQSTRQVASSTTHTTAETPCPATASPAHATTTAAAANWRQRSRWESGRKEKVIHHLPPESWATVREGRGQSVDRGACGQGCCASKGPGARVNRLPVDVQPAVRATSCIRVDLPGRRRTAQPVGSIPATRPWRVRPPPAPAPPALRRRCSRYPRPRSRPRSPSPRRSIASTGLSSTFTKTRCIWPLSGAAVVLP